MRTGSLLTSIPSELHEESVSTLVDRGGARIERIVSRGHASPPDFWYDQDGAEWVTVVQGRARVEFADHGVVELGPGDWLDIAAHERHRVAWTQPGIDTIWLAVHNEDGA